MDLCELLKFSAFAMLTFSTLFLVLFLQMVVPGAAEFSSTAPGNASFSSTFAEELTNKKDHASASLAPYNHPPALNRTMIKVSPLKDIAVNLTSISTLADSNSINVEINGVVFWTLDTEFNFLENKQTAPFDRAENAKIQVHLQCGGINLIVKVILFQMELSPCINCEVVNYNFTIGKCVGLLCQCSYCHAHICQCQKPELEAPSDQQFRFLKSRGKNLDVVLLGWHYRPTRRQSVVTLFHVSVYWHNGDEAEGTILANQTDLKVSYLEEVSDYNITFDVLPNKSYCVQVVVASEDGAFCSDANPLHFTTNNSSSEDTQSHRESRSPVLLILLSTSSALIFLSIVGYICWRKWTTNGGRAIGVHTLQCHRVQYQSSASSKSSCLTKGTYLSTEREDINVLYVEQEIQEARDKGIVDFFEISYGRLQIGHEIGKGAFGRVCIATAEAIAATPGKATVAVKYLRENAKELEKEDFLAEITTMKKAGRHPNVVTMLACCTLQQPYCMVMEYVPGGDLLNYLRKLRAQYEKLTGRMVGLASRDADDYGKDSNSLEWANLEKNASNEQLIDVDDAEQQQRTREATTGRVNHAADRNEDSACGQALTEPADHWSDIVSNCSKATNETAVVLMSGESSDGWEADNVCLNPLELQSFALQIASGMNHLSSRDIVHRDLAARNVLIDQCKRLKVADFGLSRSGVYITQRGGRVPLRWLSLEAIRDNVYSTASDVWAFGVVLWEICTLGGFPYSAVSDKDLFSHLLHNNRLKRPLHCSKELYTLMMSCWNSDPKVRPDFSDLCDTLEDLSRNEHTYVNFDLSDANIAELPPLTQRKDKDQPEEATCTSVFPDFDY